MLTGSFQQNITFGNSEEIPSTARVYAIDPGLVGFSYVHLTVNQKNDLCNLLSEQISEKTSKRAAITMIMMAQSCHKICFL